MKTNLAFIESKDNTPSTCVDHFDIEISSHEMKLDGILIEKGSSDYFRTDNVMTKDFLFAMELKYEFDWTIDVNDKKIDVHSQIEDIWVNAPNVPFSHANENPSEFLTLSINSETLFKHYQGYLPRNNLKFLSDYNLSDPYLTHMMKLFLLEVQHKKSNGDNFISLLISLFSNYFINNYSNISTLLKNNDNVSVLSNENMHVIDLYIKEHISELISIDELAGTLNMNKFHFLNEFKKMMGLTPYQYIISFKIEQAKIMLKETDESLTNIALALGFSDSSHFTRTFKRHSHRTPKDFRKSSSQ